ncbi:peroxiredoxin family protein (plasmid) [Haloferacaceae archaeon DSL9]
MYWWKKIQNRKWADDEVTVVGISISQPFDQQRFIEERGLTCSLYADPQNTLAERYDIVHDLDGMTGITEPRPAVFLVDADLIVEYAWVADEWSQAPPYDEIEQILSKM